MIIENKELAGKTIRFQGDVIELDGDGKAEVSEEIGKILSGVPGYVAIKTPPKKTETTDKKKTAQKPKGK